MSEWALIGVSFQPLCHQESLFCYRDAAQKVVNRRHEGLEFRFASHPREHLEAFSCSSDEQTGRSFDVVW